MNSIRIILGLENQTSSIVQRLSNAEFEAVAGNSYMGFIFETARYWNIAFFAVLILVMLYLMIGKKSKNKTD